MILNIVLLVAGFVLLIKGADFFVDASSNIARKLRVPSVIIGLTIVALGTSAPEAVISVSAAARGANGMAIGNAVGSNLFNLLMVVGLCAAIKPITVNFKELARDFWVSVGAASAFLIMMLVFKDTLPRYAAVIILIVFIAYMWLLVRKAMENRTPDDEKPEELKPIWHSILFALLGLGGIIGGGQLTVTAAAEIAEAFGMTQRVIGLTVVALGTSLPELVISIVAIRKKESAIAVGNVIGSNIFNLLFVLGISGIVMPPAIDLYFITDFALLIAASLLFLLFVRTGKRVTRAEGAFFVLIYIGYMAYNLII